MIVKINYKEELKGDIKETYQKLEQQQKNEQMTIKRKKNKKMSVPKKAEWQGGYYERDSIKYLPELKDMSIQTNRYHQTA